MSDEMARKKREELETIDKAESERMRLMAGDLCPHCGTKTINFPYFEVFVLPTHPFIWLECPACGVIFCPKSARERKLANWKRIRKQQKEEGEKSTIISEP